MKVKNYMKRNPVTIERDALLIEAARLMKEHSIRYLPVVEDDQLVGFVTLTNLEELIFPSAKDNVHVHEVMIRNPITVNVNASIEMAARLTHDYKIGGLPVLDKKKLVGIITASDLISAFIDIFGLRKSSSRLDVLVSKSSGVQDVTRILLEEGCEIICVSTESHSSRRKMYCFRLEKCNLGEIVKAVEDNGHKVVSVVD